MNETGYHYSKISVAYECLQKYKYKIIDKIEVPFDLGGDLLFGSAMHVAMQAAFTGQDAPTVFNLFWDSLQEKQVKYGRFGYKELGLKGFAMIDKFMRMHYKHYKPEHIEKRLYSEFNGLKYEGTPDLIGNYKGIPSIIDFKTSAYPYKQSNVIVSEQMYLYAWLAQRELGFEAKQLVYCVFVKTDGRIQHIKIELTKERMERMIGNVIATCEKLEKETVWTKNRLACVKGEYRCPYFNKCYPGDDQ